MKRTLLCVSGLAAPSVDLPESRYSLSQCGQEGHWDNRFRGFRHICVERGETLGERRGGIGSVRDEKGGLQLWDSAEGLNGCIHVACVTETMEE